MIAADTSTWISFFEGDSGDDVTALAAALGARQVVMPPPVLTELLSDPTISKPVMRLLLDLPLMKLEEGYWQRASLLRATALARKRKARLGDALIAQCCIDADVKLITRDADYKSFMGSLKLA